MSNDPSATENQENTVWQKTKYANFVRYVPSGTLFARIKIRGKLIRESLKTWDPTVAKRKLAELERRERRASEDFGMANWFSQMPWQFIGNGALGQGGRGRPHAKRSP